MRISGYPKHKADSEDVFPEELAEITLCATPVELHCMAKFLVDCAAEMDRMGDTYDHVHLGDRMKEFDTTSPHFVVCRAEAACGDA